MERRSGGVSGKAQRGSFAWTSAFELNSSSTFSALSASIAVVELLLARSAFRLLGSVGCFTFSSPFLHLFTIREGEAGLRAGKKKAASFEAAS